MLKRIMTKMGYRYVAVALLATSIAYHYASKQEVKTSGPVLHHDYPYIQITNKERLVKYFERKGSNAPVEMAEAVIKSKRPHIQAAQAVIESQARPNAKGKAGERGAWQVIPKYHGKVSTKARKQAEQNEIIIDDLLHEKHGNIKESLVSYNSFKNRKKGLLYAEKVQKEAEYVLFTELL